MSLRDNSKFLALILRHKPETIGISLDEHGWAKVSEVIEGIGATRPFDMAMLEEIVATDEKLRYSFNEDKTLIRANQGHSVCVDVELEEKIPPDILYHGTGEKFVEAILSEGLKHKNRLYVHLSWDYDTAVKVGSRHGRPVVFEVDTAEMARDGCKFYLSANRVWLTKSVPKEYLRMIER